MKLAVAAVVLSLLATVCCGQTWKPTDRTSAEVKQAVQTALQRPELFDEPVKHVNLIVAAEKWLRTDVRRTHYRVRADLKTDEGERSFWEIEAVQHGFLDPKWEAVSAKLIQRRPTNQPQLPYPGKFTGQRENIEILEL